MLEYSIASRLLRYKSWKGIKSTTELAIYVCSSADVDDPSYNVKMQESISERIAEKVSFDIVHRMHTEQMGFL